jgi:hypothetical protein
MVKARKQKRETPQNQRQAAISLKDMSSEQLAGLLNQNYTTLMQSQQNIQAINMELQQRQSAKEGKPDGQKGD